MSAQVLVNTLDMSRSEWLQHRRKGLGGSDAAAVAGLNPWKSPFAVWMEKTGQIEPEDRKRRTEIWKISGQGSQKIGPGA